MLFVYFLLGVLFCINVCLLTNIISKKTIDLVDISVSIISMVCIPELIAGILNVFGILINVYMCVVIYIVSAFVFVLCGKRSRSKKVVTISKEEIIYLVIITCVTLALSYVMFGYSLKWSYHNSDPAVHFKNAQQIIREGRLNGMYFSSLINAGIIKFASFFLDDVRLYKAYIFSDVLVNLFEFLFFYAFMYKKAVKEKSKRIFPIIYILFLFGYPMFGYVVGGYNYWGLGTVLCLYTLYWLEKYFEEMKERSWIILFIGLGCFSVSLCYMLFAPFIYVSCFLVIAWVHWKTNKTEGIKEYLLVNIVTFLLPTFLSLYYCFFVFFQGSVSTVIQSVGYGTNYIELSNTFLFVFPFLVLYIVKRVREKVGVHVDELMCCVLVAYIFGLLVLGMSGIVSAYYFNKLNYPLWCFVWIALCSVWGDSKSEEVTIFFVYMCIVSLCSIIGVENGMKKMNLQYVLADEISLYAETIDKIQNSEWENTITTDKRELYSFVLNNELRIPMIVEEYEVKHLYLYEAVTGEASASYRVLQGETGESMLREMKLGGVELFIVLKETEFYSNNKKLLSNYSVVFENSSGVIYSF